MKIILPENQSEITLEQYQRYIKLLERTDLDIYNFNRRKLEIFTPLTFKDTENITQVDFEFCLNQIDKALNEEVDFKNIFFLGNVEFGFIPNLDEMTTAEYVDLNKYTNTPDTLHYLMAILFRPIINKDNFNNYEIASYEGTKEYFELMKKTPLSIVNGSLFFFINLSMELQNYILKYTKEVQKKAEEQATTLVSGVGTLQ